ncbi:MAG: hypothetical protein KDA41_00690, partial [Planctomycetales bacterium]|nr:hypothetical protein [Planctomycetales bacterium]
GVGNTDSYLDFLAPATGDYFVGISAVDNTAYNPAVAGSGTSTTMGRGYYEVLLRVISTPIQALQVEGEAPTLVEGAPPIASSTAMAPPLTLDSAAAGELNAASDEAAAEDVVVQNDLVLAELQYESELMLVSEDRTLSGAGSPDADEQGTDVVDDAFAEFDWDLV